MSENRQQQARQWLETIPEEVLAAIADVPVIEAGFGAGPGCCAGLIETFNEPASILEALHWLARYAGVLTRAHLHLDDDSVLWFERTGFWRWSRKSQPAPRPGLNVGR